ncbi:hypothetical protein INR49_025852, partial [Caranx melampygus]
MHYGSPGELQICGQTTGLLTLWHRKTGTQRHDMLVRDGVVQEPNFSWLGQTPNDDAQGLETQDLTVTVALVQGFEL